MQWPPKAYLHRLPICSDPLKRTSTGFHIQWPHKAHLHRLPHTATPKAHFHMLWPFHYSLLQLSLSTATFCKPASAGRFTCCPDSLLKSGSDTVTYTSSLPQQFLKQFLFWELFFVCFNVCDPSHLVWTGFAVFDVCVMNKICHMPKPCFSHFYLSTLHSMAISTTQSLVQQSYLY